MITSFQRLSYDERLKFCGLTTLERRKVRGDLIETYKLMTNKVEMPYERFFAKVRYNGTRVHTLKLIKKRIGSCKQHFFGVRVVDSWNELDDKIV